MEYYHKNIITGLVITALSVSAPFAAFADNETSTQRPAKSKDFCVAIQSTDFKALTNIESLISNKNIKREARDQSTTEKRSEADNKRQEHEQESESKQKDREDKVGAHDLTDAQKSALLQVKANIQASVDTKNSDIAAIVSDYRANMDKIRTEHRSQIDALLVQVKTDVDAAIAKAKTDCASGVPSTTVKANFQVSMKAIHDKFKASQNSVQVATKAEVAQTVQARQDGAVTTRHTFRDSVKSVWTSFKSLFSKKSDE